MDLENLSRRIEELLGLAAPPVAIAFCAAAPAGVARASAGPASCSYWPRAAAGEVFYTEAADHQGCPIGAHTHGVPLLPEKQAELGELVKTMIGLEYLGADEVPTIPTRPGAFGVAVYAPLARAPLPPDVVLVRGRVGQIMLLAEAARSAAMASAAGVMGRPACAVLPQAMASGRGETSLGCIGNRVYTGLGDDEMYFAVAGARLGDLVARLEVIANANRALEAFHQERRARAGA